MQTRYRAPFADITVRLETMDRQGIDMQVVSHMPNFGYWAEQACPSRSWAANSSSRTCAATTRSASSAWAWWRCSSRVGRQATRGRDGAHGHARRRDRHPRQWHGAGDERLDALLGRVSNNVAR